MFDLQITRIARPTHRLNRIDRQYLPQDAEGSDEVLYTRATRCRSHTSGLKPDEFGRTFGVGRRKNQSRGSGSYLAQARFFINGRSLPDFAARIHDRESILLPLSVTERLDKYNVWAYVDGGGTTGQAEAIKLVYGEATEQVSQRQTLWPIGREEEDTTTEGQSSKANHKGNAVGKRAQKLARRSADVGQKKLHVPLVDRSPETEPPVIVAVVGPPGTGKSTLIKSLVKRFSKHSLNEIIGPITVVSGKHRRLTFIECANDLNSMIDVAKIADLVLL
ncbi:hypothetical protein MRB53_039218 [Persea americana]|nr:hypothetical protein MRB53_039218 [Persea americana]